MGFSVRSLCFAAVACAALASVTEQNEVAHRSLSVGASGQIRSKPVVRKVAKGSLAHNAKPVIRKVARMADRAEVQERSHASVFAGLLRADRYERSDGIQCSSGKGGETINSVTNIALGKCQESCAHDDECTCVSYEAASGTCSKQRYCHLEDCVASSLIDTYTMHSTFTVRRGARSGNAMTSVPQASFERSGGRECTNATVLNVRQDVIGSDLSVTQCLAACQNNSACTCVKYERYYQSVCTLMANCQQPTFCTRSNRYDMYVSTSTVQPPVQPTCGFQCSQETSADCLDEYTNNKATGQLPAFFSRCETEGGSAPLRSRCKLCCEACAPGARNDTVNTRTCNFQCGQGASADCKTEFKNHKQNGDLTPFHARCASEGGSGPLRSRCNLCCDGCAPTPAPTPAVNVAPCCAFGGRCADCGSDGSGFCHRSEANCGICTGTWATVGGPPVCAPTSAPTSTNTSTGPGCCAFGGQCAGCGTDGSGFCHRSAANCGICTGTWDPSGLPPAKCSR